METAILMGVIFILTLMGVLVYSIYGGIKNLRIGEERNGIKAQKVFLKNQWEKADKQRKIHGEKMREPVCEDFHQSYEEIRRFMDEEQMPDVVQDVLELKSVVDLENTGKIFEDMEELRQDIFRLCVRIAETGKKYDFDISTLPGNQVHEKYMDIQNDVQTAEHEILIMGKRMKKIHMELEAMMKKQEEMKQTLECLRNMKAQRFRCNLVIHIMDEECVRAKNRSWYWLLDDITVMSRNLSITRYFNRQTGLVFFPYEETGEGSDQEISGILAAGINPFEVRETVESEENILKDTRAILLKGKSYRLELAGIGTVFVEVV